MKQLYFLLTFICILSSSNLLAQQDSTVTFIAYWSKGETRQYKIIKKKVQVQNGKEVTNELKSYTSSFTVLDSTDTSYLIEWKYENKLFDSAPEVAAQFKQLDSKYKHLTIKYRTDEYGAFQGIENWKEASRMMKDMFDLTEKNFKGDNRKAFAQALLPFRQAMSSKEGMESVVFKELKYIHSPYGAIYSLTDTVRYEDQLPNLFGGAPINAIASLYFNEADFDNLTCSYTHEVIPTPEDSKRLVREMMDKMAGSISDKTLREQRKTELSKAFTQMNITINDVTTYSYDLDTSWPIQITVKRTVEANSPDEKASNIEETIIERIN